jgi:hypothetical protein
MGKKKITFTLKETTDGKEITFTKAIAFPETDGQLSDLAKDPACMFHVGNIKNALFNDIREDGRFDIPVDFDWEKQLKIKYIDGADTTTLISVSGMSQT